MKKYLTILLCILSITLVTSNSSEILDIIGEPGVLIEHTDNSNFAADNCKGKYGPVCNNDCKTLMVCTGQDKPFYEESCEKTDKTKPFCIGSACTSSSGSNDGCTESSSIVCTSGGIFPDPSDCTKYYVCPGPSVMAKQYQCNQSKKLIFSMDHKSCIPWKTNSQCETLNCVKNPNKFIAYPKHPGYYAFCGTSVLMFKCLDDEYQAFNVTSNLCEFNCKQAGVFDDRTSCEDYFICQRIGGKWIAIKESCPTDYKYDGNKCVRDPNCVPAITPMPAVPVPTDPVPTDPVPTGGFFY